MLSTPKNALVLSIREIFDRVKKIEGVAHDIDLAEPLDTSERNINSWKQRGTVPWANLTAYALDHGLSLDWLVTGRGQANIGPLAISESPNVYRVQTDQDIVYAIATAVYDELDRRGARVNPARFGQIVRHAHRDLLASAERDLPPGKIAALVDLLLDDDVSD